MTIERETVAPFFVCPKGQSQRVYAGESVGGKTNIYFCSIARHGGSIVYIIYAGKCVAHTIISTRFLPLFFPECMCVCVVYL